MKIAKIPLPKNLDLRLLDHLWSITDDRGSKSYPSNLCLCAIVINDEVRASFFLVHHHKRHDDIFVSFAQYKQSEDWSA